MFSELSAPAGLRPGQILDRYVVVRLLGTGGMAEVWEVRHRLLESRLALKVLRASDPRLGERLIGEGRAQAALDHENLLAVRDTVEVGGGIGLVLPLVEGPSLDRLIRARPPRREEALALFRAIVQGVAVIHAQGWVHRDLKPANVLLDLRGGRVIPRVADFGLVKASSEGGSTGFFGTPAYAAPEQLVDAAGVDARADLWSLGVLFYELLTGQRPFSGATRAALQEAHHQGPATGDLEPALAGLVLALLSVDPAARPEGCAAVLEALDAAAGSGEAPLRAPGLLYEAAWALRREATPRLESATVDGDGSLAPAPPPQENLPPRRDRFLGRGAEIAAIADRIREGARLLTLLGAGGAGKTRLAVEYAASTLPGWPGGVWFCDLTEARDADGVMAAVARGLGVALGRDDPAAQIGHAMAARGRALFILDNAEQVADATAALGAGWRARAGSGVFLVTSRAPLGDPDEQMVEVGPLDLPRDARLPAEIQAVSAGALLVARAVEAVPGWTLRESEVTAAAELLHLLDGLPLAIELAAARLRLMSLSAVRERIRDRFKLLAAPGRGDARQATMRAVLDWSWNLLSEPEQSALAQMSVFEGGFTLDAAEAVVQLAADAPWTLDVLQLLLDRSLLRQTSPVGEEPRFGMYVSVRDYAAERLAGSDKGAVEARYGAFFARFGTREAREGLYRHGGTARRDALGLELDNLAQATRRALDRRDTEVAVYTLCAAGELLARVGAARIGGEALARAVVALCEVQPPTPEVQALRALAYDRAAQTVYWLARPADALILIDEGLRCARATADPTLIGRLGCVRANVLFDLNLPDEAYTQAEESDAIAAATGDLGTRGRALRLISVIVENGQGLGQGIPITQRALEAYEALGDIEGQAYVHWLFAIQTSRLYLLDQARQHCEISLRLSRAARSRDTECRALMKRAILYLETGELDAARPAIEEALQIARTQGNRRLEALTLLDLAEIAFEQGRYYEAIDLNEAGLVVLREQGRARTTALLFCNLGFVYLALHRIEDAERAFEQAMGVARTFHNAQAAAVTRRGQGLAGAARGDLEAARRAFEESAAQCVALGDPTERAFALLAWCEVEARIGDPAAAAALLAQAQEQVLALGAPLQSRLGRALASARRGVDKANLN